MEIKIYSQDGTLKLTASPGSGGQCVKQLQGDSELSLSFDYFSYVALDVNDYVDFCGDRYWLLEQYRPKEVSTIQWRYDVKLYGIESLIKRYLVIEHTDGDANPVFTLTAPASQHMLMIVECLNNATGTTDWHAGTVLATGNITIDYTGKYCDEGLRELAEAANTEYWFSGDNGKTLNLSRCERGETIELEYGAGLISLERDVADNAKFYTRLYPVGSSRNINPETYGHTRLQLPNNQKYVDLDIARYGVIDHYEQDAFSGIYPRYTGTVSTVRVEDRTDEDGTEFKVYFIKDASLPFNPNNFLLPNEKIRISFQTGDLQGLGETDDHYFEADYNSTTGEFEIINIWTDGEQLPRPGLEPEAGNSYIPWNISMPQTYNTRAEQELAAAVNSYNQAHFVDNSVYRGTTNHVWIEADQSRNIYIGRLVKLVSSQYFPGTGYRNSRIVKITRRLDLPSQMELEISDAVSTGTLTKINDDIRGVWDFVKGLETDDNGKWLSKRHNDTAQGLIRFIRGLQVGERFVTGLLGEGGIFRKEADGTTYIEADKLYIRMKAYFDSVEIRDYRHSAGNRIASVAGAKCCRVDWIDASGNSLKQTSENLASTVLFRCYFRGSDGEDEVRNNFIVGDLAYCHITTVETEDDSPIAKGLNMTHYWRLIVGRNAHGTLTDDGEHWIDLSNRVSETVTISGTSYTRKGYQPGSDVPAAQNDIIQLGNIRDTDRQGAIIEFVTGADAPSYQIFQGIGSDVSNPYSLEGKNYVRFGYDSESGGAQAFIGNPNGSTYLWYHNVTEEGVTHPKLEIKAEVSLSSTFGGKSFEELVVEYAPEGWTEEEINQLIVDETDPLFSDIETALDTIQRQVDGSISTWFYDGTPTLSNLPASEWTTADLKNAHLGDLYYDNLTGYGYRFKYDETSRQWSWVRITDVDVTKALADAAKAQDTADHKRRVFVVQPTPPYDQGDLWVNATYPSGNTETNAAQNKYYNDVLRCNTTKASGTSFAIADWGLASKYTDDQALLVFKANQYVQQLTNGTLNQGISNAQSAASQAALDAAAAQAAADNAQTDADAANDRLDDWADDGVISPTEKTSLKVNWEDMKKEYVQICNDADKYSVSKTAFASAYTSANAAFQKYTASTPENITIGSDYANIAAYYAARQTIMDAISVAAKKVATDAQAAADAAGNTASSALTAAQAAEAHAATMDAVKQALNQGTLIDGGLVLSTFIGLRDTNNTLWSGISGAYSTTGAYGGGLAAWFGGGHVDRRNSDGTWNNVGAKVGFRFDGSGYVAGGAISWDATGLTKVTASKISALEIDLNGDEVATENWVSDNFVSITFFERLFQAYNGSTIVHPNSTSTIDNIKAMFGFWTEQYISALGQGSGGSSGVGDVTWDLLASSSDTRQIALSHLTGALSGYATQSWVNSQISGMSTSLAGLSDVNVSGVTSGQFLMFNGQGWIDSNAATKVKVNGSTYNVDSNGLVDLGTISGSTGSFLPLTGGTLTGSLQVFSTASSGGWNEGVRMHVASNSWCGVVMCGSDNTGNSGTSAKTWSIHNNDGTFYTVLNGSNNFTYGLSWSNGGALAIKGSSFKYNGYNVLTDSYTGFLPISGGALNSNSHLVIGDNNRAGSWANSYISCGAGYGKTAGVYGVRILVTHQSDSQWGLGSDLNPNISNGYDSCIASCLSSTSYCHMSFVTHAVNSSTYYEMGHFDYVSGAVTLYVKGAIEATSCDIKGSNGALALTSSGGDSWIYYKTTISNTLANRASSGYYRNFAFIANETTYARIGVADDGTPQYWPNATGNTKYTLIHSGNISTQGVGSAATLTTARSLWGQSFNGSADITGNIKVSGNFAFNNGNGYSIDIENTNGAVYAPAFCCMFPNCATSDHVGGLVAGKAKSKNNSFTLNYGYRGDQSTSNFVGLGFYSNDNILIIKADKTATFASTVSATSFLGNATSATTLQTARSLWGNSFNGSGDINGNIRIVATGTNYIEGVRAHVSPNGWVGYIMCGSDNTGSSGTSAKTWGMFNNDGNFWINKSNSNAHTGYEVCNINGNWGIATVSPSYKLHVAGTGYFENNLLVQSIEIGHTNEINATGSNTLHLQYRNTGNLVLCNNGKNVGISTTSPSYKLHVAGDVYATGGVTCLSDIREKMIVRPTEITVEQIAKMPSIVYRWKDNGNDHDEHVGSIAQDWQKTLPQVVLTAKDEKKTLSLQYGVAALISAITIARKVVDHERRIKELEDENRKLKEQLKIA